ncbi:hypothetical protein pb186bvf_015646 [Paramecium bursaria]
MGSVCKQQLQAEQQNEVRNTKQSEKKEYVKRNTESSNSTLQYNQGSTKQFSVQRDPLARYMDESLSDSDSEEESQKQPVFTNFVTFQAMPSQKQMKPKFEFMKDQFINEMQQIQNMKQKK